MVGMVGDGGLGEMILGLQHLRAQNPAVFGEIARALDTKMGELLEVCRAIETRLRQAGDTGTADLLGIMVLEWETTLEVPALTFPFLLERNESPG